MNYPHACLSSVVDTFNVNVFDCALIVTIIIDVTSRIFPFIQHALLLFSNLKHCCISCCLLLVVVVNYLPQPLTRYLLITLILLPNGNNLHHWHID